MIERPKIENTIGKTFADMLDTFVIDASGEIRFTRRQMIEDLGCANFAAASRLERVLNKLKITTIRRLFNTNPMDIARVRGIGATSIYVAMCILDYGQYDVEEWWGWKETNNLKFSSYKHNVTKRASKRKQEV